ncbi:NADP-dependent oxidoreductase [Pararhizobium sp. DWP3-4]|uniref:NADP-dependent oxidoreductase n=1 Tax=unclassified Pararhizobium TaxID=2643050 RepID=UPI003CF6EAC7
MNDDRAAAPQNSLPSKIRAVRVHEFGGISAMNEEEIDCPVPTAGQVLVKVAAAGVGPWDGWIRSGNSVLPQPLPLTLGSDLAGTVVQLGPDVTAFAVGDEIFGVTNPRFTNAYAQYALADANMISKKPGILSFVEAASVPVVASTAWQMLFDRGGAVTGTTVLVLGGAGNVGAYAVQFAAQAGARVLASALPDKVEYVKRLGAVVVIESTAAGLPEPIEQVDLVVDAVGGQSLPDSFNWVKSGGRIVSAVSVPDREIAKQKNVDAFFHLVRVNSPGLEKIAEMIGGGKIATRVGDVLELKNARLAHEMLEGKRHKPGKIVLTIPH